MRAASFVSSVVRLDDGAFRMHALTVPHEVAAAVRESGTVRVVVTLAGDRIRRALQTRRVDDGDGREHILLLSADLMRTYGLREGVGVPVTLEVDPNPDDLGLPDELVVALECDPQAGARFNAMTPGRQRSLGSYVASAKRAETREKRAVELATKLRTHTLYGDLNPDR